MVRERLRPLACEFWLSSGNGHFGIASKSSSVRDSLFRTRDEETRFAHQLIEHGIAVVHGHSSHHVKTAEIHSDRLVLYGCGDFLNDYEGISGHEVFRSDLRLMYLPAIDPRRGQLVEARLVPMRVARFRLNRGAEADAEWLCDLLNRLGVPLGTRGELAPDHTLTLHPFT